MKSLLRTRVGRFELADSLRLAQIEELAAEGRLKERVLPVDQMFEQHPKVVMCSKWDRLVYNGNPFDDSRREGQGSAPVPEGLVRVYDSGNSFVGVYRFEKGVFHPVKMFLS